MVFLMVFYIFGVSLYIVMYESVESPNLFQYNRSVIKNEVLNYKWPCRLLLRLKIPHKICDQMTFKKWKRWGFQLTHSPSGQYRLTVNIRLAALLHCETETKTIGCCCARVSCNSRTWTSNYSCAILHATATSSWKNNTNKSEKDLSPSEGQYMCLIMGTNRNFCSFFNQKYICFYLFKYYLRNDPFLRTQNDDDDACTLS